MIETEGLLFGSIGTSTMIAVDIFRWKFGKSDFATTENEKSGDRATIDKRANNACSGLGGGPCKKAESKRKHFSISTAASPTKPLTRAVGQALNISRR